MQIASNELSDYYLGKKVFPDEVIRTQIACHEMLSKEYQEEGSKVRPLNDSYWQSEIFCTLEANMFASMEERGISYIPFVGKFDEQLDKVADIVFKRYLELLLIPTDMEIELHILFGQETNDSEEEFVFAHTDRGRVKDEQEDESTSHIYPFGSIIRTAKVTFKVHP